MSSIHQESDNPTKRSRRKESSVYKGYVTNQDLRVWGLKASQCMNFNDTIHNNDAIKAKRNKKASCKQPPNRSFMIVTEKSSTDKPNVDLGIEYEPHLLPSHFCPNEDRHLEYLDNCPLSVACPTCWSSQRHAQYDTAQLRPPPKRRSHSKESKAIVNKTSPSMNQTPHEKR